MTPCIDQRLDYLALRGHASTRREWLAARARGFLVTKTDWVRLRNLWCHRATILGMADVVVTVSPRRCRARIDLLPASLDLDAETIARVRREIQTRGWRARGWEVGETIVHVRADRRDALAVGRYLLSLVARATPRYPASAWPSPEIGRASCRERVYACV